MRVKMPAVKISQGRCKLHITDYRTSDALPRYIEAAWIPSKELWTMIRKTTQKSTMSIGNLWRAILCTCWLQRSVATWTTLVEKRFSDCMSGTFNETRHLSRPPSGGWEKEGQKIIMMTRQQQQARRTQIKTWKPHTNSACWKVEGSEE